MFNPLNDSAFRMKLGTENVVIYKGIYIMLTCLVFIAPRT